MLNLLLKQHLEYKSHKTTLFFKCFKMVVCIYTYIYIYVYISTHTHNLFPTEFTTIKVFHQMTAVLNLIVDKVRQNGLSNLECK